MKHISNLYKEGITIRNLLVIICLCMIVVSLSIAYYFVIFLPKQQLTNTAILKKIEQSRTNTEENTQNTQSTADTSKMQDQLNNINNTLQQQQEETDKRNQCEANGGKYLGNGSCCLTNCSNWIGQ